MAAGTAGSGRVSRRLPKRRAELPPRWEPPLALGCFGLPPELCLALRSSLRAAWKKPLGAVPMDAILKCSPEDLEDYYNLLGCDELSTVEQILAEYKIKALECHPDKHPGNPKAVETFQKLQRAKETLTHAESRARYDFWRRSRVAVPFQQWEALSSSMRTSMHWAVQSKKDQMLEAPDFGNTNSITKEMWTQETGNNGGGLLEGSREQEDVAIPDVKPQSSKNPDSPRFSEGNYWHLRFRWSGDAPSDLLRKFRNYEI
ncbi:dnaJ homolog subfamily C member 12 isoform X1 [Chamaea fasciata]|uniref:dnaJ homolog subfamily C member 12 isoform X1 n=2 Tax=Chamaea fasciata TaxID=190680 RepID=UPI00336AEC7C